MRITYKYAVGYGRQHGALEVDDETTYDQIEDKIEELVKQAVYDRLCWSWAMAVPPPG